MTHCKKMSENIGTAKISLLPEKQTMSITNADFFYVNDMIIRYSLKEVNGYKEINSSGRLISWFKIRSN